MRFLGRRAVILLTLFIVATLVAACGVGAEPDSPDGANGDSSEVVTETASTPAGEARPPSCQTRR
jgi:hypothetical protein